MHFFCFLYGKYEVTEFLNAMLHLYSKKKCNIFTVDSVLRYELIFIQNFKKIHLHFSQVIGKILINVFSNYDFHTTLASDTFQENYHWTQLYSILNQVVPVSKTRESGVISIVRQNRSISNFINLAPDELNVPTSREIISYVNNLYV